MKPKLFPLEFFYVMNNPMKYTQNSGFPSVISWSAVDYMKLCNEPKSDPPRIFYVCDVFEGWGMHSL